MRIYSVIPSIEYIFEYIFSISIRELDLCIIRSTAFSMLGLIPILLLKRLAGARIVIDLPVPNVVVKREIWTSNISILGKIVRILLLYVNFPWSLWAANRVLQYSDESPWFSLGVGKRSKLVSNGISVDRITLREETPTWPSDVFVMVGVAALAPWHGFDRIIEGINRLINNPPNQGKSIKVKFLVVGNGRAKKDWESLVRRLGLEDCVEFLGVLTGSDLNEIFNRAHLAIGSLGVHRNGLKTASPLKAREYVARGIPFVHCGHDLDFEPVPNFLFKVPNNDEPIDLANLINWFDQYSQNGPTADTLRQYAIEKLDYKNKVSDFIN